MEATPISVTQKSQLILEQVRKAVVGKDAVLAWALAAFLAKGHILLEDIPGVGKTTMAVAFSRAMGLSSNRVQFTPDVLPSDVTGYSVLNQTTGEMTYRTGAVICNLFLADELNRATSRTQSALLEAMEEGQVTVDGKTYPLPQPFTVVATQNPAGAAGTQLLPDSQVDRFTIRLSLGYPDPKDEIAMVMQRQGNEPMKEVEKVVSLEEVRQMQEAVANTFVAEEVVSYVVSLVDATRRSEFLLRGASPRATLAVIAMAKAVAQLSGRDYVVPEDVQSVFSATIAHRLQLSPKADGQGLDMDQVVDAIMSKIHAPKLR